MIRVADEGCVDLTAEKIEKALQYYYGDPKLELVNIQAGVNASNGYSYLIYGLIYDKTDIKDREYHKMVASEEYKNVHEKHKELLTQKAEVTRAEASKKNALSRIEQIKKEMKKLKDSIPELEKRIQAEKDKLPSYEAAFKEVVENTDLPMPYHAKIWMI